MQIENLGQCTSLRLLNLSYNEITSLDGLMGLQSLEELKCTNNNISSLKALKALPSLVEIDVSCNMLTSIDGIQFIPSLEVVHAESNLITSVSIGQTYSRQNQKLDKGGEKKSQGLVSSKSTGKLSGSSSIANSRGSGKRGSDTASSTPISTSRSSTASTADAKPTTNVVPEQVLGMRHLTDVFLGDNKISSLKGLDRLGAAIETLDISNNVVEDIGDVIQYIRALVELHTLNISGNPMTVASDDDLDHIHVQNFWKRTLTAILNEEYRASRPDTSPGSAPSSARSVGNKKQACGLLKLANIDNYKVVVTTVESGGTAQVSSNDGIATLHDDENSSLNRPAAVMPRRVVEVERSMFRTWESNTADADAEESEADAKVESKEMKGDESKKLGKEVSLKKSSKIESIKLRMVIAVKKKNTLRGVSYNVQWCMFHYGLFKYSAVSYTILVGI